MIASERNQRAARNGRTNAQKREAVLAFLNDPNLCQLSDREISRRTRVSQPYVSKLRKAVISQGGLIAAPGVITAAHGADGGYLEAITESPALRSYGWTIAEPEEQRRFVDGVGLRALFNAAPQDHRDAFIAWLVADLQRTERPSSLQTERIGGRASGHELDIPPNLRRGPEVRR
jgi:hypothetical protein